MPQIVPLLFASGVLGIGSSLPLWAQSATDPPKLIAEGPIVEMGAEAYPFMTVLVHGHPMTVTLDVGTTGNLLSPSELQQFGIQLTDGLDSMNIGTTVERNVGQWGNSPLEAPPGMPPMAGLLGTPVLSHYDIVFDGPAHRVRLYPLQNGAATKPAKVPSWFPQGITPADCMPIQPDPSDANRVFLSIRANGRVIHSMFDSGTGTTNINLAAARALKINKKTPGIQLMAPGTVGQFPTYPDQKVWRVPNVVLVVGNHHLAPQSVYVYEHLPRERGPADPELSMGLHAIDDRVLYVSYSTRNVCLGEPVSQPVQDSGKAATPAAP